MPKITEEQIDAIVEQIMVDIANKDYTAIYKLIEKLADLDSAIITPMLLGFLKGLELEEELPF